MTDEEALAILAEISRRAEANRPVDLIDRTFPKQAAFLESPARFLAGFCTRRAGKSYGIGLKLCQSAVNNPGVSTIYIGLTRESAKRIIFKDVLKVIDRKHDLGGRFNHTDLTVTFPNGSVIYCLGMDASREEAEKALGQKFYLAVVDEAGSFRQDLRNIVYGILKPAVADYRGQIILIGTPNNVTKGLYYDTVWAKTEPGWEVHSWSAFDNPYMCKQWAAEIEELTAINPRIIETPQFRQNYLGEYVIDQTKLVYRVGASNFIPRVDIPPTPNRVLGIDLGFTDATAFSLLGFRDDAKRLYVVHAEKKTEMTLSEVAQRIEYYIKRFNPYKILVDNAAKQAVEELKQRYGLPLHAADKTAKSDFIEMMNADYICGNILIADDLKELQEEYASLIWDDRASRRLEHPSCENHLADATLYAWRYTYQYTSIEPARPLTEQEKLEVWLDQ